MRRNSVHIYRDVRLLRVVAYPESILSGKVKTVTRLVKGKDQFMFCGHLGHLVITKKQKVQVSLLPKSAIAIYV